MSLRERVLSAKGELLDLCDLGLGAAEAAELCALLRERQQPQKIASLVLHGNELGDAGATAIAVAAGSLRSLNLYGNAVGAEGALALSNVRYIAQ